jgi:Flp pilus assembly protein TadG
MRVQIRMRVQIKVPGTTRLLSKTSEWDSVTLIASSGRKAPPLAKVPVTTRLLSKTSERDSVRLMMKRTPAEKSMGVFFYIDNWVFVWKFRTW